MWRLPLPLLSWVTWLSICIYPGEVRVLYFDPVLVPCPLPDVRSLLSKAVLALSLSPLSTPMSLHLTDKYYAKMSRVISESQPGKSPGLLFVICFSQWNVTSREAETFIFSFTAVSIYDSAWHIETMLLLLLVFLTSYSGIHSALLLYKTVQYMGFSYFITG